MEKTQSLNSPLSLEQKPTTFAKPCSEDLTAVALSSRQIPISWDQTVPPSLPTAKNLGQELQGLPRCVAPTPQVSFWILTPQNTLVCIEKYGEMAQSARTLQQLPEQSYPYAAGLHWSLSASCSCVPMDTETILGATRGRWARAVELCCKRTKPNVARFQVPAGALTPHNCFKPPAGEPSSAQLTGVQGCSKGRVISWRRTMLKMQLVNQAIAWASLCIPSVG